MLIGYVGNDPEVQYVDADTPVARLRIATSERGYTLPNGTQVPQRTEYVPKGDRLYIGGRLRYSAYNDKEGARRTVTEIWAENIEILSTKN